MRRNKENIESYSTAELELMKTAGQTRTDWNAAARKPIPDSSDADDAMEAIERVTTELPMPSRDA